MVTVIVIQHDALRVVEQAILHMPMNDRLPQVKDRNV